MLDGSKDSAKLEAMKLIIGVREGWSPGNIENENVMVVMSLCVVVCTDGGKGKGLC